jgi:hypothetical protein
MHVQKVQTPVLPVLGNRRPPILFFLEFTAKGAACNRPSFRLMVNMARLEMGAHVDSRNLGWSFGLLRMTSIPADAGGALSQIDTAKLRK